MGASLRVHSRLPLSLTVPLSMEVACSQDEELECTLDGRPLLPSAGGGGGGGGGGGVRGELRARG